LSIQQDAPDTNVHIDVMGRAMVVAFLLAGQLLHERVRILNMTSGLGSMGKWSGIKGRECVVDRIFKAGIKASTCPRCISQMI